MALLLFHNALSVVGPFVENWKVEKIICACIVLAIELKRH